MLEKPKRRPSKKAARKKRDIAFHNEGIEHLSPEDLVQCDCGHTIEKNRSCKHHIMKKRTEELRYDHRKAIRMCFQCHNEIEAMGDVRWARANRHRIPAWVYDRLIDLRGNTEPVDDTIAVTLSDIL